VIFLEAIAAAGFAFLLLGEPVSLVQGLGGLLILAGIYVARPTGGKAGGGAAGRG
jgi:drug/metabolite transporter (DMT)-like permease